MRRDAATGLLYRRVDAYIVAEVKTTYAELPVRAADVMLDLGANIGATSLLALSKGAARVVAVEADPGNIPLLRRNLGKRGLVLWGAVGPRSGRVPFYADSAKPFLGSRIANVGARLVHVPAIPLAPLFEQHRPTIVKCDIEFGEYDLDELRGLPDFVRVLSMEIHIRHRRFGQVTRRAEAVALVAAIEAQGFRLVRRADTIEDDPPIADDTGLHPRLKAINAIWQRP